MRLALAVAAAAALSLPAAAGAQEPQPPPPPPPPAPAPAPPPPVPQITMVGKNVLRVGGEKLVLQRRSFRLLGTMTPAVAGQRVELAVYRNGKPIRTVRAAVGADGTFTRRMPTRRKGRISVLPSHAATPELGAASGPKVSVEVVEPRLSAGDDGPLVRLLQRGLAKLRYAVPRSGSFDAATGRAVMAFRKVNRMALRYDADRRVVGKVLAGRGAFKPRHPGAGRHAEADISRQVLALIDDGKVVATYHTSTGAPATPTIIGSFRVYRKDVGTNSLGMLHSSYFIRGYAIHGYVDVPAFNASHGCLRVPIPDAWRIFTWLRHGDRVITYP
jgi:peptidoglycan hydrolase-like protein with peptidoglycan-binding domain